MRLEIARLQEEINGLNETALAPAVPQPPPVPKNMPKSRAHVPRAAPPPNEVVWDDDDYSLDNYSVGRGYSGPSVSRPSRARRTSRPTNRYTDTSIDNQVLTCFFYSHSRR